MWTYVRNVEGVLEVQDKVKGTKDGKQGNCPSSGNRTLLYDLEWLPRSLTTSILFYELDLDRIAAVLAWGRPGENPFSAGEVRLFVGQDTVRSYLLLNNAPFDRQFAVDLGRELFHFLNVSRVLIQREEGDVSSKYKVLKLFPPHEK